MMTEEPLFEEADFLTYFLTPTAKASIRKALG
jgi:hypothetical protein